MPDNLSASHHQRAEFHTIVDVENAIGALDSLGMKRLRTAALDSLRRYGLDGLARDHEDLLSEAFMRLLSGGRRWRRDIGFEYQMARVMDSIASDWRRRDASTPEVREADVASPNDHDEEDALSWLPDPPSPERSIDHRMIDAVEAQEVAKLFADDSAALQVLECMYLELSRREMCERTQMSDKQLEAAIRRVRRGAERLRPGPPKC